MNEASIASHEENTKEMNVGTVVLSDKVNTSSSNATSTSTTTAEPAVITKVPQQATEMIHHAPKTISTDTAQINLTASSKDVNAKTKCLQCGKLPMRTNRPSSSTQVTENEPQENVAATAAGDNADKELKDSSESSDESMGDEALNIPQKVWDLNSYDQMFAIMPHFNLPTIGTKKLLISFTCHKNDTRRTCKTILIGLTSKHLELTKSCHESLSIQVFVY